MTFPETEILTPLVQQVFQVDNVTRLEEKNGTRIRYRGHLLSDDSASAYDQLAASVKPYKIIPLFRIEDEGQVIELVPELPAPKRIPSWISAVLFLATFLAVMLAGVHVEHMPEDAQEQILTLVRNIHTGWPFAISLLAILLAHELGHYFACKYYGIPATLPYFIPLPFLSPLGTMGAFILMQGIPKNKRQLFDVGVAGPLAGLVVTIPVLLLGLSLSNLTVIETTPNIFLEGNSLFYLFAKYLTFGKLLPAPPDLEGFSQVLYWIRYFFTGMPFPFGADDVLIHPVAFAGWAGLLVTSLNLLPAGTLDGGHVVYSLFGEKARKLFPYIIAFLVFMSLFWLGWLVWIVLLLWLGRVNSITLDQITPLDPRRRALGFFVLGVFVLTFMPVPISVPFELTLIEILQSFIR